MKPIDRKNDTRKKCVTVKKRMTVLFTIVFVLIPLLCAVLVGCGNGGTRSDAARDGTKAPKISGLKYDKTLNPEYAKEFNVHYYKNGYKLIVIKKDAGYLLVPKGGKVPKSIPKKIKILREPVDNIYLAATASMSLFASMNALDKISMSSLKEGGWTFDSIKKAMKAGKIQFSGKYSEPDYEMLVNKKCKLAIESTMIYHSPEVKEMIEGIPIPVMVDRSSYESHPLGRTEWIKLYGALIGKEDEADRFFKDQERKISKIKKQKNTGKTIAFFYISTDGKAIVRRSTDYIPSMIGIAGGKYIFKELDDKDGKPSIPMTMEKFYDTAANADYIVYNASIDSSVKSLKDLVAKDPVMKNFKAVRRGNCWTTGASMYQRTDIVGDMISDFNKLLTKKNPEGLKFIKKLK